MPIDPDEEKRRRKGDLRKSVRERVLLQVLQRRRQPVPKWFRDAAAMRQAARATYGQRIFGPGHFWPPASRKGGPEFTPPTAAMRRAALLTPMPRQSERVR